MGSTPNIRLDPLEQSARLKRPPSHLGGGTHMPMGYPLIISAPLMERYKNVRKGQTRLLGHFWGERNMREREENTS